jgi:glycosyltransferase involved in cell wall biosynthesis
MTDMKVSVIIPTYNGAGKIGILLNSLLKQINTKFEVIVVVDGSTDTTVDVLNSFQSKFETFKIIVQENRGRAAVRNRGAQESSGNILIFYDDDMEIMENSVVRHISFHTYYDGIVAGNPIEERSLGKTDIQNYKATRSEFWINKYPDGLSELNHSNLFFTAANCSIKRSTFFSLNGFDERLSDAEDYDLAYRALQQNISVFFDKSNRAFHHDPITAKGYIQRLRQYGRAHSMLKNLNPDREINSEQNSLLKRSVYGCLGLPFLVRLIDKGSLQKALPEFVRFKLYDLIIHALAVEFPNRRL